MKSVAIGILSLVAALSAQDNLAFWTKYKVIAINTKSTGANVAANVTKFPVLVRLDSLNAADVFSGAAANGADIRFSACGSARQILTKYRVRRIDVEAWMS